MQGGYALCRLTSVYFYDSVMRTCKSFGLVIKASTLEIDGRCVLYTRIRGDHKIKVADRT